MKLHTHTVLTDKGNHLEEVSKRITISYDVDSPHFDSIEKILSLLDMIPGIVKTETAAPDEL